MIMKSPVRLNLRSLIKLGFTPNEARVYKFLMDNGPASVVSLAKKLKVYPNALYRLLSKLTAKELISSTGKHPAIYRAISPQFAFDGFVKKREAELKTIRDLVTDQLTPEAENNQTRIDLLKSSRDFFLTYSELAKGAVKEILVISIGESVPEEVMLANRDALERGVNIRFIAHKCDSTNRDLLRNWKKMGLEVKHFPDWGFHLVVFDGMKSMLSVNNPNNTDERIALVIYSRGLAKAYSDYFYSVWDKAEEIK